MDNKMTGLVFVLSACAVVMIARSWDRLGALQSAQAEERERKVACEWIYKQVVKEGKRSTKQITPSVKTLTTLCYGFKTV